MFCNLKNPKIINPKKNETEEFSPSPMSLFTQYLFLSSAIKYVLSPSHILLYSWWKALIKCGLSFPYAFVAKEGSTV